MKLVIKITETDNYTYSNTIPTPFEYESKEKFISDALEDPLGIIGKWFDVYFFDEDDVLEILKRVYTLEEWFEEEKIVLN